MRADAVCTLFCLNEYRFDRFHSPFDCNQTFNASAGAPKDTEPLRLILPPRHHSINNAIASYLRRKRHARLRYYGRYFVMI